MNATDNFFQYEGLATASQRLLKQAILDENRDREFNAVAKLIKKNNIPLDNILQEAATAYIETSNNAEINIEDINQLCLVSLIEVILNSKNQEDDFIYMGASIMTRCIQTNYSRQKIAKNCKGNAQIVQQMMENLSGSELNSETSFDYINEAMIIGGMISDTANKSKAGSQKGKAEKKELRAAWDAWTGNKTNITKFINSYIKRTGGTQSDGKRAKGVQEGTLRKWVNQFKNEK